MTEVKIPQTIGEFPHKPHYEVRTASQSYSNIAAVLAGFAFAAVVLVVQIPNLPHNYSANADSLRDWATISFLVAFAGCILSAFTFAVVAGEEILAPRSHTMALLGAAGFAVSANLIIWGLVTLIKIFLSQNVYGFIHWVFAVMMSLSPLYAAFSAFDPKIQFERKIITRKDLGEVFVPSFVPLLTVLAVRYFSGTFPDTAIARFFPFVMGTALGIIILSAVGAIFVSSFRDITYCLSMRASGIWVGIHSIIIGLLILMM